MNPIFNWIIPPAIGAVIGYVTNALAIKMLFRPLAPRYIAGIRIPFTPGILPKQRHILANSIGRMVERELLTPEILQERLARDDVYQSITTSIAAYTSTLLTTPLSAVRTIPAENPFSITLKEFFNSTTFDSLIIDMIDTILKYYSTNAGLRNRTIRDIIGTEQAGKVQTALERIIEDQLKIQAHTIAGTISHLLNNEFSRLSAGLLQFLKKKEIRTELEVQGQIFISKVMLKLGTFQRFFLSVGQYDQTLHGRMPEIIDDLISQIEQISKEEKTRRRFLDTIVNTVEHLLSDPETAHSLAGTVSRFMVNYADKPLGDLLNGLPGEDLRQFGATIIQNIKNTPGLSGTALWDYLFETYRTMSLAGFFSIDAGRKNQLDSFLAEKILAVANNEIGAILTSINVRTLVSDRIDSLSMIDVERIVLDVMASQFKWINVFGGILGALIGLVQAGFSWLTR
jgi:uncharacterized membrane protein YheB (UPF0754 family)